VSDSAAPSAVPSEASPKSASSTRAILEWVVILAAALAVAIVVKTFLIQAFYIPSGSMEPTLMIGDRVLVNKLSYDLHSIHRGDIVVFKSPPSEANDPTVKDLIKRVIGLPGDQIQAINGQVYIDGKVLNEPYLPAGTQTTNLPLTTVAPGKYYVLGDNRGNSKDSRFIGQIPRHLIVGRDFIKVWPIPHGVRVGLIVVVVLVGVYLLFLLARAFYLGGGDTT
jgi:signal peptidase I